MTGDAEWLAWRTGGIGASEVAASWTGHYGGAYAVVAKKLGLITDDINPELADRGHRWEQPIADAVHALTGYYVVGEQTWCEQAGAEHRRATVDGFLASATEVTDPADLVAVLEVKTVTEGARPKRDYYTAQVQAQMMVTGQDRAVIVAATIGRDDQLVGLYIDWVDADPDTQTMLAAEYDRLWAYVTAGQLPDPEGPSALELVKQATASADTDADTVSLDDIAEQVAELGQVKHAMKAVKARHDELDALVRHRIGAATRGECDGWVVTYSQPPRVLTRLAEDALLVTHPELGKTVLDRDKAKTVLGDELNEWKEPAGARRLTIKETKK